MSEPSVRLRFAPSPTGPLHLGGARTALYNWAAAQAMGGKFLLRIEDTDRARSTDESLQIILAGLSWLGLAWDEGPEVGGDFGPYFQTERLELYAGYAERLLESGWAYKCYATPEEVQAGRERLQAEGKSPMYDRRDRDIDDAQRAAYEAEERKPSLRFRMPLDQLWKLEDLCKGEVEVNLRELDDWVMLRPGGMPTYNFACVVDDLEMRISHVVRGDEHFMNGIKQSVLFHALDAKAPKYAHIPLILGKNGKKLSKRDAVTNILDYRDKGYLPEAIFNYISLLGWSFSGDQDLFTVEEMLQRFRIEDIGASGSKFDEEKLLWMNGEYIRKLELCELLRRSQPLLLAAEILPESAFDQSAAYLRNALASIRERISLLSEVPDKLAYLFVDALELDKDAEKKLRKNESAPQWLAAYADLLEKSDLPASYPADRGDADIAFSLANKGEDGGESGPCMSPAQLEQQARDFAESMDVKFGHFVHPVRAALSGTTKGPGLFDIVFLLGKERCCQRLRAIAARP